MDPLLQHEAGMYIDNNIAVNLSNYITPSILTSFFTSEEASEHLSGESDNYDFSHKPVNLLNDCMEEYDESTVKEWRPKGHHIS